MVDAVFARLRSHSKLERDAAISEMQTMIASTDFSAKERVATEIERLLSDENNWESRHGGLAASLLILGLPNDEFKSYGSHFGKMLHSKAVELLNDEENRVRTSAGEAFGRLCGQVGKEIYEESRQRILSIIEENMQREDDEEGEEGDRRSGNEESVNNVDVDPRRKIFHDTAGWKSLEAGMTCLRFVVRNLGSSFDEFVDLEFLELIFACLVHTNRFVRETGFQLISSLVKSEETDSLRRSVMKYEDRFCAALARGLADNWSQVRLAASVATRQFLLASTKEEELRKHFAQLLPRICLNRYYVAEGVRIYSQETWKLVARDRGRLLIEEHIDSTVDFYISQTTADNHAVREAACACIAELGAKISHSVMQSHVERLLPCLLTCFRDDSWPVRDAACVACGNFVKCFPQDSRSFLDELYHLFFDNLADGIPSVRQGAALALANVVEAYGKESLDLVMGIVRERLPKVKEQTSEISAVKFDTSPALFGVVKRARDNDMDLHTDKLMYSCGSLAPKMKRGAGCMHSTFRKVAEPWEEADGCVNLVAELSRLPLATQDVLNALPVLADSCNARHYQQHFSFLETTWKQLPRIAKGVQKRNFKRYLEHFFPSLFYSLDCSVPLTCVAAKDCFAALKTFVGENILRGRIEQYDPRMLEKVSNAFLL
ncbi:uncharacterized protein [Oscarella lobularis]|uniref:uncharacterized protein n=1 Tax=Oscarella lobularis TaxID=121494 RepID=UPI003313BAE3